MGLLSHLLLGREISASGCHRMRSLNLNRLEPLPTARPKPLCLSNNKRRKPCLFLLSGQVKLSMNSSAGRRVILGIAYPGETLGLASVVFRKPVRGHRRDYISMHDCFGHT